MGKDIDEDDLEKLFATYEKDGDGKMLKSEFILGGISQLMTRSVEDSSITTSFFS